MNKILMLVIFLVSTAVYGGKLYRWTDESGQVHYGDVVPEAQKHTAKEVKSGNVTVTDAQRREAEAVYAKDKAWLKQQVKPVEPVEPPAPVAPASSVVRTSAPAATASDKKSKCEEDWKRYRDSLECTGRYRTALGGIKEEVTQHCPIVSQPSDLCDF
jgi:hypothetical protein